MPFAVGLSEVLDENYLEYRAATVRCLADRLQAIGIKMVRPREGTRCMWMRRASFRKFRPHSFLHKHWSENFISRRIRAVEIGSVMFGRNVDGVEIPSDKELVRLALPRRVYTQAHVNYVADIFAEVYASRDSVEDLKITKQGPFLRHFSDSPNCERASPGLELISTCPDTGARRGRLHTPHGIVGTPAFMPVGTAGSVKNIGIRRC